MMADPAKDTLDGTSINNGASANAGAPSSKVPGEVLEENLHTQADAGKQPGVADNNAEGVLTGEDTSADNHSANATTKAAAQETEASAKTQGEDASTAAQGSAAEVTEAAEAAEWKDKYVRLHAEWDTYRRRMGEQREEEKARATEKLVVSLLPVLDDLERTIDYAEQNGETGLLGGVQAVMAKFVDILQKDGVQVIDPKGEEFNALEGQAVGTVEDATQPDETVADVYQKGYKMGNKVLRPAMVTVTTGGPKREQE